MPSLRVAIEHGLINGDQTNAERRLEELLDLEGHRLKAQQNIQIYQTRIARAYDKLVKGREFKKGDLVMVKRKEVMASNAKGKLTENGLGPYICGQQSV